MSLSAVRQDEQAATALGFRTMMSAFPTGVGVVTAQGRDGVPRGMTCSSVCSVSLAPPTLLVCLRAASPTLEAVLEAGEFAVNLLHEDGQEAAELFASGDPDRFTKTLWDRPPGAGGPHLLQAAHTVADCVLVARRRVGDHMTVFGEIRATTQHHSSPPLLYGLRQFRAWSRT